VGQGQVVRALVQVVHVPVEAERVAAKPVGVAAVQSKCRGIANCGQPGCSCSSGRPGTFAPNKKPRRNLLHILQGR
jgi:uncharacterized membrane protein